MTNTGEMNTRISVAMATFNGEKYIEEQLVSICRQTRKPDEIVVSDDGSTDSTLEIVRKIATSDVAQGIEFVILTDNIDHGFRGNFEWAIKHTSGYYVFLCDQDDVWLPEKVEKILEVFQNFPDAQCVCHNATMIGKKGEHIEGIFDESFSSVVKTEEGCVEKLECQTYLVHVAGKVTIRGMSMCITRALIDTIIPFPRSIISHDKWITFQGVLNNVLYYVNTKLARYRLHGNNLYGNAVYKGTFWDGVKRKYRNLKKNRGDSSQSYFTNYAMLREVEKKGLTDTEAYSFLKRVTGIGEKICNAEESSRVVGAYKLCKLFCTDMRYRRSGFFAFLYELTYIVFTSRRKRVQRLNRN